MGKTENLTDYIEDIINSPTAKKIYSKAQRLGITLEKWLFMVLSIFFPQSKGYRVQHNHWNNYTSSMGYSTDIRLFLRNKLIAVFECKNWRLLPTHRYGLEAVKREIISRFHNCGTNIKVLTISFKEQISKKALSFLESNNILILETGKLIGKNDFRSKLVYSFGKQIKQLISNFKAVVKPTKPLFSYLVNSGKLTNCSSSNSNSIINKNDSDLENIELSIMNVKHPQHKQWLNSELERLEKADKFRELAF